MENRRIARLTPFFSRAHVIWISADPVSGSSIRMSKAGSRSEYDRTELEPMGQEVLPVEPPAEEPDPAEYAGKYAADEPEWTCQAAEALNKTAFEMPGGCMHAALNRLRDNQMADRLASAHTENNTARLSVAPKTPGHDLPVDHAPTAKQQSTTATVQPASLPCEESEYSVCTKGGPSADVTVYASDDPNEMINAEYSSNWASGDESKLFNRILDKVKKRLEQTDKNGKKKHPDCAALFGKVNVMDYLYNNVAIHDTKLDGSAFANPGQAALTGSNVDAAGARVAKGFTVFNKDSFFFTGTSGGQNFIDTLLPESSMYGLSLDDVRELVILHEVFHVNDVNGKYDDNTNDLKANLKNTKGINKKIRDACF